MVTRAAFVVVVFIGLGVPVAIADDPIPWDDCGDCVTRRWISPEPGIGPDIGPLARVEFGVAGVGVDDAAGGDDTSAALARIRVGIGLSRTVGVRATLTGQALAARPEPFPYVAGASAGGAIALGITRSLGDRLLLKSRAGLTLDGELATGPAVRSGLGLRTLSTDRRLTLAPGVAVAWDFYVGSVRAHARYLQPVNDPMATGAVELGLGASTRINWAPDFWGGSWPLEAWLDYRYRVGAGETREHEVRGGLDYTTPTASIDRIGVELAGTGDRLADGTPAHGLTMMIALQLRGGS